MNDQQARLADGVFYRHWPASGSVRGVILLAHGLGEHSGRYQGLAEFFCPRGIAVVAPDHFGHGHSPGHRAHIGNFAEFLQPLLQLRALIAQWYPSAPCFLLGHSLGGLIAARLLLDAQDQFAGAALSAPALAVAEPPSPLLLWLNRVLARLWPTLGMLKLDASQVSRDPEVVAAYEADPLVHHGKVSARLVAELFATMEQVNVHSRAPGRAVAALDPAAAAAARRSGCDDGARRLTGFQRGGRFCRCHPAPVSGPVPRDLQRAGTSAGAGRSRPMVAAAPAA